MRVFMTHGTKWVVQDAAELVRTMHDQSMVKERTDRAWMRKTADRVMLFYGTTIRFDRPNDFVADLCKIGMLSEVED